MLLGSIYGTAQILQQENFDALTTATAIGQSSPVYAFLGGANSDYSVVTSGTGKALQISAPGTVITPAIAERYMWKNGLAAAWTARTAGNNVFQVEYDYFTGSTSTSNNGGGIEVIDDPAGKVFCGLTVHQATKTVLGVYTTATGTNSSTDVGTGTTPAAVTLPANTWVRLGFAYNTTNGTVTFKGPGFSKVITGTLITTPAEIDYAAYPLATNTVASIHLFDNMIARAVATESLNLATSDVVLKEQSVSIFPSPATDFINVESKAKILNAYIYDMTGVRSDANFADSKVDVRKLPSGVYMLGLKTENGLLTKKFIKK
ncbi:T9SS type A sorting domain-containing protein [Chryseobacterium formosus]|uniref:T9SS type A sorting domain-containing protein n=1 Tax=Chryseobacterium formosus TaxID=1537363 RepID=A0ABT3XMR1_9FLAO|nr:T9SS type A sorting domain-containing protein [Chryseobacterium formosus]MCX8523418.1 T9SS type A sorting domain-containing protein [Chryseobacterium formosus]